MWSAFANAWQSALQNRGIPAYHTAVKQMTGAAGWTSGLNPFMDEMLEVFDLPKLADIPAFEPGALPSLAPAAELAMVTQQYMFAAFSVAMDACKRFQAEIEQRRKNHAPMESAGEAMDLWNNILDQTLMEFNRSEEFATVQQRFLRAAMQQRQEVRKLTDNFAKVFDLPTREEVNDMYRRLHDLLREVHGLRREIRALKNRKEPVPSPVQKGSKG
jgi:Poly(R)-hydroxyalkanoic acid synthase subunit (PHA_synth_III_E)